jgi:hypothetical protein
MNELYFHEDDYCQIELLPIENEEYVKKEINTINEFSEDHKAPSGAGWTDMYIRDNREQITLKDYKIKCSELDTLLLKLTEKCDKVYTGYSSYREECDNTLGYSLNNINIFVSFEDNLVTKIWFDFYLNEIGVANNLYNILKLISTKYDLLFVHWSWGYCSKIKTDLRLQDTLIEYSKALEENNDD